MEKALTHQSSTASKNTAGALVKSDAEEKAAMAAHMARSALRPDYNAAAIVEPFVEKVFGRLEFVALGAELKAGSEALKDNDLSRCEQMLFSQAHALQAMFTSLARRANSQDGLAQLEVMMRLALKAQAQSRATLETLAAMKNPTAPTFVKQANIAHGPQQVNNGPNASTAENTKPVPARGKSEKPQNELLEVTHEQGQRLDTRPAQGAIGAHPAMEAVGAEHGAANRRRKSRC